jgi:hypothetical protein
MIKRLGAYTLLSILCAVFAYRVPVSYSYADYKAASDLLFNMSGMVFTIMGIWIAFLYPNALSRLASPQKIKTADFTETLEDTRRLESIVASVLKSGVVAVSVTVIGFSVVILKGLPIVHWYQQLKSAGLGALVLLILIQLDAVWSVLVANVAFINDLHRKREDRQANEGG